jgi:anti-anti-sigma factor
LTDDAFHIYLKLTWCFKMITVNVDDFGTVVVLHFYGILTRDTIKEVEETWTDQIEKSPDVIAFDLRDLTQIDSISINHVFKLSRIAAEKNIKLIIFDANESLKKIFEVIKLDKVITFMSKQKFESEYLKRL